MNREYISQSDYSELLWRATILEEMTGIPYVSRLGSFAIQLELF